jgi:radical SAM protein with 4Fe4S-binding SPASM domain
MPGFNIYRPAADFSFLLDVIGEYRLTRSVRLGLAHPGLNRTNQYLHPRHYGAAGREIAAFVRQAREADIRPELDCGFVPCMFCEEDLALLGDAAAEVGRRCNPLPDILPDGRMAPCYPLAPLGDAELSQCRNAEAVREAFERKLGLYRPMGIYRECSSCGFFTEGSCNGGCLAAAMGRLQGAEFRFMMPKTSLSADDGKRRPEEGIFLRYKGNDGYRKHQGE